MENLLNEIIDNAHLEKNETDYIKDGLLHCGMCNEPKECVITIMDIKRTVPCLCKCGEEERTRKADEVRRDEERRYIRDLRSKGFSKEEMKSYTFDLDDKFNPKISQVAKNYANNFSLMKKKGKGLIFTGNVGSGKTFLACCIANDLIDKGHSCLVTNFSELINRLTGMYEGKQDYLDELNQYELLIIDDLGAERSTDYVDEIVWNIIDARYRKGLPMIITTNLNYTDLSNPKNTSRARVYSRLLEMCLPFEFKKQDRRANTNFDEIIEALKEGI